MRIAAGGGALGEVPMVGSPIRLDGERQDAPLPPPGLGEHREALLGEWVGCGGAWHELQQRPGIVG